MRHRSSLPNLSERKLRVIAAITEARTIKRILTHLDLNLDLDDEPPHPRRIQGELRFTEP